MTNGEAVEKLTEKFNGAPLYEAVVGEIAGFIEEEDRTFDSVDVSNALDEIRRELDAIENFAKSLDSDSESAEAS